MFTFLCQETKQEPVKRKPLFEEPAQFLIRYKHKSGSKPTDLEKILRKQ